MRTNPFILCCFLFCVCSGLRAQDSTAHEPSRFKIGITGSGDYCTEMIYYDGEFQGGSFFYNYEHPAFGWSAGITTSYSLSRHFEVTGGLRYREHRLTSGEITLTDRDGVKIGTLQDWYISRYTELALGLQYVWHPDRKVTFLSNVAITPGYAMGSWFKYKADAPDSIGITDGQSRQDINNFNPFSLTAELYAGAGIQFGKCQIQILPQARYHLLMVTTENPVNRRNWSAGLEVRLVCSL